MTEIKVTAAPAAKDLDTFTVQVRNHISKVANLCGWDRDEREYLMQSVIGSEAVAHQWRQLEKKAAAAETLPVWEWNRFVRRATDELVSTFYQGN